MIFYVGSVALQLMITPWPQIPFTASSFAAAFNIFGIPGASALINIVVFTAALSVLNSGLYTYSRMLYALGGTGWAPPRVTDTNRRDVPGKAILLSTVVAYVAIAMNYLWPDRIFAFLMNSAGAVALFVYLIIAVSQLRLPSQLTKEGNFDPQLKMWLHPWLGLCTIVIICVALAAMGYLDSTRSQLLLSLVSVAALLVAYPFARRSRQRLLASASTGASVTKSTVIQGL